MKKTTIRLYNAPTLDAGMYVDVDISDIKPTHLNIYNSEFYKYGLYYVNTSTIKALMNAPTKRKGSKKNDT